MPVLTGLFRFMLGISAAMPVFGGVLKYAANRLVSRKNRQTTAHVTVCDRQPESRPKKAAGSNFKSPGLGPLGG
jgi:hypothetical protein